MSRVDRPADGEHAEHPGHTDLAGVAADPRLGELRAERVHPVVLDLLVLRGLRGGGVADVGIVAVVLAEALRGSVDRRAPGADARRAALHRRRRQVGVADLQVDRVDVAAQASAAIWVSAVQVPVPMSAAPICTA